MTVTPASLTALPHYDLLIIGAGVAGLSAGRIAQQAGQSVMLIDKGRRVGGRVSSRRADGFLFNHGAQFATSTSADFSDILGAAAAAGMATDWQIDAAKTVMVGTPMMRALPMFLAGNLPIQQNRRIARIIRKTDHIQCVDTDDVPVKAGGKFRSNWDLGYFRASAVANYMMRNGVKSKRVSIASFADQRPIAATASLSLRPVHRIRNLVGVAEWPGLVVGSLAASLGALKG